MGHLGTPTDARSFVRALNLVEAKGLRVRSWEGWPLARLVI